MSVLSPIVRVETTSLGALTCLAMDALSLSLPLTVCESPKFHKQKCRPCLFAIQRSTNASKIVYRSTVHRLPPRRRSLAQWTFCALLPHNHLPMPRLALDCVLSLGEVSSKVLRCWSLTLIS